MNWIEAARQATSDYLARLRELVEIDSGTYNKAGVDAVGERVAAQLDGLGCRVRRHPLADYGDCFEATLSGQGEGQILLVGHSDTVYPDGTAAKHPLRVEGEKALGPGAADMKGGLLLGVCALRTLKLAGFEGFERLTFFINSEEEIGSPASRELYAEAGKAADVGLVLEPGRPGGQIVSARKGVGGIELIAHGRSAHAGVNPQDGASAVQALASLVTQLYGMAEHVRGATFNVGVFEGGTRSNVIAEEARALVDVRVEDMEAWHRAQALLRQVAGLEPLPGVTVEMKGGLNNPPMPFTPVSELLVTLARQEAEKLEMTLGHVASGGGSDANYLTSLGTPCLDGLGPQGAGLHSPEEYILLQSVAPRTALLAALIPRLIERRHEIRELAGR